MRLRDAARSIEAKDLKEGMRMWGKEIVRVESLSVNYIPTFVHVDLEDGHKSTFRTSEIVWIKDE